MPLTRSIVIFAAIGIFPAFFGGLIKPLMPPERSFFISGGAIAIAAILALFDLQKKGLKKIAAEFRGVFVFLVLFATAFAGPAIASWLANPELRGELSRVAIRIAGSMLTFLLILIYGIRRPILRRIVTGFFLAPIALAPIAVFVPRLFQDDFLLNAGHLSGWIGTPKDLAFYLIPPALFLFSFFIFRVRPAIRTAAFILLIPLVAALFWTSTRGPWLGALIAFGTLAYLGLRDGGRKIKRGLVFGGIAVTVGLLAFAILPCVGKSAFLLRITGNAAFYLDPAAGFRVGYRACNFVLADNTRRALTDNILSFEIRDNRSETWEAAIGYFFEKPLFGYGPLYYKTVDLTHTYATGFRAQNLGAHNIFLEATLAGGLPLLLLVLYFYYWTISRILTFRPAGPVEAAFPAAFMGILAALFFVDGISMRWFWIFAALAFIVVSTRQNEKTA